MTNRFLAGVAFSALVMSVLALFVALSATDDDANPSAVTDVATTSTSGVAANAGEARAAPVTGGGPDPTAAASQPRVTADAAPVSAPMPTAAAPTTTAEALPGAPGAFGPSAGSRLGVVGVRYDDWLNMRDVPNGEVVATLAIRLALGGADLGMSSIVVGDAANERTLAELSIDGVIATGRTRNLATSTWHEIQAGPVTGWASSNYLAPLSPETRNSITAQVVADLDGSTTAATLTELVDRVVATIASSEPRSRVRVVSAPGAFEGVAEVAVDVVGQPDDSVRGYRLLIDAQTAGDWMDASLNGDIATDAGPYTLQSVLATPLCYSHRGLSENNTCN
ncbi:hypothetical protein [Candidatus Poriferisodalis sp.]|uniref:hypothetical protein n=1 Tax=Candidatus Poriferisodalis sp. TaxID=3101277 RepID=UPI003B02E19C